MPIDPVKIKAESEAVILNNGGQVCDWLPHIDVTSLRRSDEVIRRALILNAMLNIYFQAPTHVISAWIDSHGLTSSLSPIEVSILARATDEVTEQERINLYWYMEALWAFMWSTQLVSEMDFTQQIPNSMASLCPNLQKGEGPEKFTEHMRLRKFEQLYKERDLYFRLMWWARQSTLTGKQDPRFNLSVIMERRKAIEWITDASLDWDDVPLNT